jgi:hypothetical protein
MQNQLSWSHTWLRRGGAPRAGPARSATSGGCPPWWRHWCSRSGCTTSGGCAPPAGAFVFVFCTTLLLFKLTRARGRACSEHHRWHGVQFVRMWLTPVDVRIGTSLGMWLLPANPEAGTVVGHMAALWLWILRLAPRPTAPAQTLVSVRPPFSPPCCLNACSPPSNVRTRTAACIHAARHASGRWCCRGPGERPPLPPPTLWIGWLVDWLAVHHHAA